MPFIPSVMINISPDWKGRKITRGTVAAFHAVIQSYLEEGMYQKWKYVLECGGNGDHLHAHIVAEYRHDRQKTVNTHLTKGRHSVQIMKYAEKVEGIKGYIKGPGIHKKFLRTPLIVKDTLDYLEENKKPKGHKNAEHPFLPIIKEGGC